MPLIQQVASIRFVFRPQRIGNSKLWFCVVLTFSRFCVLIESVLTWVSWKVVLISIIFWWICLILTAKLFPVSLSCQFDVSLSLDIFTVVFEVLIVFKHKFHFWAIAINCACWMFISHYPRIRVFLKFTELTSFIVLFSFYSLLAKQSNQVFLYAVVCLKELMLVILDIKLIKLLFTVSCCIYRFK